MTHQNSEVDRDDLSGNATSAGSGQEYQRREFLKAAGVASLGLVSAAQAKGLEPKSKEPSQTGDAIPMRPLGRATDVKISALGLGGHHLGDVPEVGGAIKIVHQAIEGGITFFDNCWEYHNGKSENWMGRALAGRRDKVFLMTKVCTHGRSATLAMQMLEQSLRRLQTDHLDLWQVHGMTFDNDPDLAYAKGGVLEALDQAKKQGKVRFVGFTGHKDPAIHLRMVLMGYPFDTVQMPLNPFDANFLSFEKIVLPELNKRGIAALGMKPMNGNANAIQNGVVQAEEMLRYAMSLPVATTITGIDSPEVLQQNLRIAQNFQPMSPEEMNALRARCADLAGDGRFEPYKVSLVYDNPQARLPHGFPLDPQLKEVKDMFEGNLTGSPI
jgi:aryl-alcohol dehydrogenase-like predicted oxidoreductase